MSCCNKYDKYCPPPPSTSPPLPPSNLQSKLDIGTKQAEASIPSKSMMHISFPPISSILIIRAHSFPRQNLTNSAVNLVNSAAYRGKADEIPRLTTDTHLHFRGLIKSSINKSNTCYELMNQSLFIH